MSKTICIIDHSPTIRAVVEINLVSAGFTAYSFADGPALFAWLTATSITPDVMLLDIDPPANGLDIMRHLQQAPYHLSAFLLLSATIRGESEHRDWEARECAFLRKPFVIEDLLALIAMLLVRSSVPRRGHTQDEGARETDERRHRQKEDQ